MTPIEDVWIFLPKNLDPNQDRHSVGPDLGPNCSQKLSAERE